MDDERERGPWDDVLRVHTAAPTRAPSFLGVLAPLTWLVVIGLNALLHQWLLALVSAGALVAHLVASRRRTPVSSTDVSGDGLRITGERADRYLPWDRVEEVHPRAPWARWATVRTCDGSTVAVPGITDDAAESLERLRSHLAAARRAVPPSAG